MVCRLLAFLFCLSVCFGAGVEHDFFRRHRRGQAECVNKVWPCQNQMAKYAAEADMSDLLKSRNIRQTCQDIMAGKNCFEDAINSRDCSGIFTYEQKQQINKLMDVFDYVCVTSIEAIERNSDCFLDPELNRKVKNCPINYEELMACDASTTTNCFNKIYEESDKCGDEAYEITKDLFEYVERAMPGCGVLKELVAVYSQFFK